MNDTIFHFLYEKLGKLLRSFMLCCGPKSGRRYVRSARGRYKKGIPGLMGLAGFQKPRLILSAILAVAGEAAGLWVFYIIYKIVSLVVEGGAQVPGPMSSLILWGLGAVLVKHVCRSASTALSHMAAFHILHTLRVRLLSKLTRMPLGYFGQRNSGEIKKILSEDVERIELFLAHNIPEFTGAMIYFFLVTCVLFVVDPVMAAAALGALPLGIAVQALAAVRSKEVTREWLKSQDHMNSAMIHYIHGMPVIKAYNQTAGSFVQYASAIESATDLENRMGRIWQTPMSIFQASLTANLLLIMPVGAVRYLAGDLSMSTFIFFLIMGIGLGSPMFILIGLGKQIQCNIEGWDRIAGLLSYPALKTRRPAMSPGDCIKAQGITFGYTRERKVINGIDLTVSPGRFIALVGPSGAGKSTLARLLPRFWDPDQGKIMLGDADLKNIEEKDLMAHFGLVFQNIFLFNGTIEENVLAGNPDATGEEVIQALEKAGCMEFINTFPKGIKTNVGEKGGLLSGGQKQRISIARAILKNAPVLILDEATAFIDPENEVRIQKAVNELVRDKTLIVIAHRLSTVTEADTILVVDQGRIAEQGTHDSLLDLNGLYARMWEAHQTADNWHLAKGEGQTHD